ncbi:vWA domain-containing protein [Mangrovibrevibacter kandeliae]|uniref:vWA domain-containing protein n=1 Tax=Mangrovibrevibacter kandeliae TaxID=2968473 RepID=UPI00389A86EE
MVAAHDEGAAETGAPAGKLAENIAHFARTLRRAGLVLGPAATLDAIAAVEAAGIGGRDDFYWLLHAVLVKRHEDSAVFDAAFEVFWRPRDLTGRLIAMLSPIAPPRPGEPGPKRAGESRVADALAAPRREREAERRTEIEIDARLTVSGRDLLRTKDFAQMSAAELQDVRRAMAALVLPNDHVATRRFCADPRGERIDPRGTLRLSLRSGGDLMLPAFRSRRIVQPPLVVLADISGSMSQYSRIFLHFLHALCEKRRHVHTFLFGTRLTNVTHQMRHRDPDAAVAAAAAAVEDWSGGTRIADAIQRFNRDWSRRVLTGGAVCLLITDGLEREGTEDLGRAMERLHKSSRRLIWLNPLLRFDGFSARAQGVRAMLPHVDELRPVHSLEAIGDLCAALSGRAGNSADPRRYLEGPAARAA